MNSCFNSCVKSSSNNINVFLCTCMTRVVMTRVSSLVTSFAVSFISYCTKKEEVKNNQELFKWHRPKRNLAFKHCVLEYQLTMGARATMSAFYRVRALHSSVQKGKQEISVIKTLINLFKRLSLIHESTLRKDKGQNSKQ